MRLRPGSCALLVAGFALWLAAAAPAAALTLGFDCISGNRAADCAIGESQLRVDVGDPGAGRIAFAFRNTGPEASSITDIYWDEDGALHSIFSISSQPGLVEFEAPATPGELPAANGAAPAFVTSAGFSADSNPPVQSLGVNPGETLVVTFILIGGMTFGDAIQDLTDGSLRIGIHAQGFASGGSESFVNTPVPEPGTFGLIGAGMLALALARRRR